MNHLAHALLADGADVEFALGSALGDFQRGPPPPAWPAARRRGLRFHRAVDRCTDTHPEVVAARRLFRPPYRRYAGILLDVWFDHLLVRAWNCYSEVPVTTFSARWLQLLDEHRHELPPGYRRFLAWMHAHGLPAAYGDQAVLVPVLQGLAGRLSRPSPIGAALPELRSRADALQRHFDAFFPALVECARQWRAHPPTT